MPWLRREIAIMPVVAGALGPAVPRIEYIGGPSERFPYPFTGYRKIRGTGADQVPRADAGRLAADLGQLLSRLHRIDPASIPPTPEDWENEPGAEITADLVAVAGAVAPLLSAGLRARAEPYLAGAVPWPPAGHPRRFVHNDICPDHVLVDRRSGRLAGLIDWTDAMVGDPVADFAGLIGLRGFPFIHQVAARYELPLGDTFAARLQWRVRTLTLTWLAEAASDNPAAIAKLLSWASLAFADCASS